MEKVRIFRAVKGISFLLVFCLIFNFVSCVLVNPEPYAGLRHYQYIRGYFEEPVDSLDAVFIGPSNVYASWVGSIAWKMYGVKIRSFTSAALGGDSFKSIIQNIHDLQPNALYIICTNSFLWNLNTEKGAKHDLTDYWPTVRRTKLILDLYNESAMASSEMLEYLAPLIRFHSRWVRLLPEDFHYEFDGLKGESVFPNFLEGVTDVSENFHNTHKREELSPKGKEALNSFLSYCKENDIKVLFIGLPWATSEHENAQMNYVTDVISNNGFTVMNLLYNFDEIGLDGEKDFYNNKHPNIHGALKITDYLTRYLVENYTFPEKTGGGYESWDEAYSKFFEIIKPYLTDEELKWLKSFE